MFFFVDSLVCYGYLFNFKVFVEGLLVGFIVVGMGVWQMVGMICLVCYIWQIEVKGMVYWIDGGLVIVDFQVFFVDFDWVVGLLISDDVVFDVFVKQIFGVNLFLGVCDVLFVVVKEWYEFYYMLIECVLFKDIWGLV